MKKKRISVLFVAFMLTLGLLLMGMAACADGDKEGTVTAISVSKMPDKVEYVVDEEFSAAGGEITATYDSGESKVVAMTDEGVQIDKPNMSSIGKKTVTVRYGGARTTFSVTVDTAKVSVVFDYNYSGAPAATVVELDYNSPIRTEDDLLDPERFPKQVPDDPERQGYTFWGWFTDKTCTEEFEFEGVNFTEDTTVYAYWLPEGEEPRVVYFHYNYQGLAEEYTRTFVQAGGTASAPSKQPSRTGYRFDGWYTAASGGSAYDFDSPVTGRVDLYAHWTKTQTGTVTWTFEAENIDLSKKSGPGLSGSASQGSMVVYNDSVGASGGAYVSFLYRNGLFISFEIVSDVAVNDVTFEIVLSREYSDYTFNQDNYIIALNDQSLDYSVSFTNVPKPTAGSAQPAPFKTVRLGTNLSLKEGANVITLTTNNNDAVDGSTMEATAPLVDCIKLTTSAVLIWDGSKGLPMQW